MSQLNAVRAYSPFAILLHWSVAVLILANLATGWIGEELERGRAKFALLEWHMSLGLLVLVLSAVRLGWRWIEPPPPPLTRVRFEAGLAKVVHAGLLAITLLGPLTGAAARLAEGRPLAFFGVELVAGTRPQAAMPLAPGAALAEYAEGEEEEGPPPGAVAVEEEAGELWQGVHALLTKPALVLLLLLHLGGALKHHLLDRDDTLRRMLGLAPGHARAVSGRPLP